MVYGFMQSRQGEILCEPSGFRRTMVSVSVNNAAIIRRFLVYLTNKQV